jgi:hypothetical protein
MAAVQIVVEVIWIRLGAQTINKAEFCQRSGTNRRNSHHHRQDHNAKSTHNMALEGNVTAIVLHRSQCDASHCVCLTTTQQGQVARHGVYFANSMLIAVAIISKPRRQNGWY